METSTLQWIPVPFEGYNKVYEVSNTGIVRRRDNKKERRQYRHKNGYLRVLLSNHGKQFNISVHRLVALAFVPNPSPELYSQVGHWDDEKTNNNANNLYWTNAQENNCHGDRLRKQIETLERKREVEFSHRKGKRIPVFKLIPTSISGATAVWYCSISEASRENGIKTTDIRAAISGIRDSAGGYRWVKGYEKKGVDALLN